MLSGLPGNLTAALAPEGDRGKRCWLQVLGSLFPNGACPVGGGVLIVTGDAGLKTSFAWDKPMGPGEL